MVTRQKRQAHRRGRALQANVRSVLSQRRSLAGRHGMTFGGDRDLYTVLGYPKDEPDFLDYMARYTRQDIAGTIVDFPAEETWRDVPVVKDGEEKDADEDTPFEFAWRRLSKRLKVWQNFEKADKLAGIHQYAVLVIGVAGEPDWATPLQRVKGDAILYLRAYGDDDAPVEDIVDDSGDPRFGLPKTYRVNFGTNGEKQQRIVHASRVLHIAENALENGIYGRPRLQRVYNRLLDLEKVVGGSSEAFWKLIRKGMLLDIDPAVNIPDSFSADLEEQLDEYDHGLRRYLKTRGLTATDLGSEAVDPSGLVEVLISLLSSATGIPKRILIGSERGELSSDQDARMWSGRIARRRTMYAEPLFVDEFLTKLIGWGALPLPLAGEWSTHWQPLFELSQPEQATVAVNWAIAFEKMAAQLGPIVSVSEYRQMFTPLPTDVPADLANSVLATTATEGTDGQDSGAGQNRRNGQSQAV